MTPVGRVAGIALRTGFRAPMREVQEVTAHTNGGLEGDNASRPERGITLLSAGQWRLTCAGLDTSLPWHTRRANVLIECATVADWIGRTVMLGAVRVEIHGETRPCGLMDRLCNGLKAALAQDIRAGVHGRIVNGGVIRVGDQVIIDP